MKKTEKKLEDELAWKVGFHTQGIAKALDALVKDVFAVKMSKRVGKELEAILNVHLDRVYDSIDSLRT